MTIRDDRRPPNRRDALPGAGPDTFQGQAGPLANVIKLGVAEEFCRVPEDADAVMGRSREWYPTLKPQNLWHAWLVDQISVTTLRIERLSRIERRQRDRSAARASLFWDDDRRLEAEERGAKLADDPAATVNSLRRTPRGCDWLLDRWAMLARAADRDGGWDEAQIALASRLLGTTVEAIGDAPGSAIDLDGRLVEAAPEPPGLARREVAALLARREEVAGSDALDRAMAEADLTDGATPEARRLRRHEAELHGRLRWYFKLLNHESKRREASSGLRDYFDPQPEPEPEPEPEPSPVPAGEMAEVIDSPLEAEPEVEPEPTGPAEAPSDRLEAKLLKAEARRKARSRKLERRRA